MGEMVEVEVVGLDGIIRKIKIDAHPSDLRSKDKRSSFKKDNVCKECGIILPPRSPNICAYCSEQRRQLRVKKMMKKRLDSRMVKIRA